MLNRWNNFKAIILPFPGEITPNNLVMGINGVSVFYQGSNDEDYQRYSFAGLSVIQQQFEYLKDPRLAKMCLVSYYFEKGDTIVEVDPEDKSFKIIKLSTEELYEEYGSKGTDFVFKIIGTVSKDAIWVQEEDEFNNTEIQKVFMPTDSNFLNSLPIIKVRNKTCRCYH